VKHELKRYIQKPTNTLWNELYELPQNPNGYVVYVYKRNARRSLPQNALYWKWLHAIAEHSDGQYEPESLHEAFKRMFNPSEVVMNKVPMTIGGSTAGMKKKEFSEYLEKIQGYVIQDMCFPEYLVRWPNEMDMDELAAAEHINQY
jgi:hypothetical protein